MPLDANRLQTSLSRLDKFLKKVPKDPTPETIHEARTSIRRLESALDVLKLKKKSTKKRLQRNLPQIRKRLGKVRDMDVLTAHALNLKPEAPEKDCLVQLLEHLGAQRVKHLKKLRKAAKKVRSQVRADLSAIDKKLAKLAPSTSKKDQPSISDGTKISAIAELAAQLQAPTQLNRNNLHLYRLKVKELRDVLQLSLAAQNDPFVTTLGNVKDAIGEWHDWEQLVAIATKILNHAPHCNLLHQLKTFSASKFQKALTASNKMRATYLHSKHHKQHTKHH
jgi:CHAD domain-containing protein